MWNDAFGKRLMKYLRHVIVQIVEKHGSWALDTVEDMAGLVRGMDHKRHKLEILIAL